MEEQNGTLGGAHVPATDIAIVGMACRVPGADNPAQLWRNVAGKVESIRRYTDDELRAAGVDEALLRNPNYVRAGGPLGSMEMFDAAYFGFGPRDAAIMDPQHRHFLECCVEALEDAGQPPASFAGAIGLFAGCGMGGYFAYNILTQPALLEDVGLFLLRHTGNDKDFLTTRVSYCLNLRGPSVAVQTACSTSLVAVHLACQSLLAMECDMALAGGVTIEQPHRHGYLFKENEVLSPDGHCRAFAAGSKGTVLTSGLGVVALRRLSDALRDGDPIHAVIKATAVNNDGSGKVGYLAPSVEGHAAAVAEALALSGIDPATITLFEAHGTGTQVGDPIEITALTQAYRAQTDAVSYCAVSSLKTNIGHLDTAAGVAGLIKVAQALAHQQLPPSLHFDAPNPIIDFAVTPFYVNTECKPWPKGKTPRRAALSSLGVGGTNAHAIFEEAPVLPPTAAAEPWQLLLFSGKSAKSADGNVERLAAYLADHPDRNLADVAFTLQAGRPAHAQRRAHAVRDAAHAVEVLQSKDSKVLASGVAAENAPPVVFMFPGGGAQYLGMGRDLYARYEVYRVAIDQCLTILQPLLAEDLRALLLPSAQVGAATDRIEGPLALPVLFATEYALAQLWLSWGIEPDAMTGHSLGEYTAACLAGVMSLSDALALVVLRSRLLATVPAGVVLGVPLPEADVLPLLGTELSLAAVNGPELCAVSGPEPAVAALEAVLAARDVEGRRLRISVAAHSAMLDPILDEFRAGVRKMQLRAPSRRFISNLTGTWADPAAVTTAEYWVRHLRHTVRFADGMATLMADKNRVFLEVGPGTTLCTLARMQRSRAATHEIVACLRHPQEQVDDVQFLLTALGRLWCVGKEPDWSKVRGGASRRRLSLPAYAFDHQRYFIEPGQHGVAGLHSDTTLTRINDVRDWFHRPSFKPTPLPPGSVASQQRFVLFLDDDGPGEALAQALSARGHAVVRVQRGPSFQIAGKQRYLLNPADPDDYVALLAELAQIEFTPDHFVHLWLARGRASVGPELAIEEAEILGFYTLLSLAQALVQQDAEGKVRLTVVTDGAQRVFDEPLAHPERATVLGPVQVIPRELSGVRACWVDVQLPVQRFKRRFDPRPSSARALIAQLVAEVTHGADDVVPEPVVALRPLGRFVQQIDTVAVPKVEQKLPIVGGGAYLITGGLGGIGLACARWLAAQGRVGLALLSRTGLPPRHEWPSYRARSADDAVARAVQAVLELEALGAKVLIVRGDVGDPADVTRVVAQAREVLGPIRGVLHAAGVIQDGLIAGKRPESAARVLSPKVRGTLNLEAALAREPLDFFVLFSSTSTALGLPGQIDYVAANAFLDAFAQSRHGSTGTQYLALAWGVWAEVGMAVQAARQGTPVDARDSGHPWLGRIMCDTPQVTRYEARYVAKESWLLDEHRVKGGHALVPGTGYLEIARAALHKGAAHASLEIADLTFLAPLQVEDDKDVDVRVELEHDRGQFAFTVGARGDGESAWRECARGSLGFGNANLPAPLDLSAIAARCTRSVRSFDAYAQDTQQEKHLAFGPRWKVLRKVQLGAGEGLAWLELGREYADDVKSVPLHPALLDLGCHFGLPLIEGYAQQDALFVPLSFGRVRTFGALPARVVSHVRLAKSSRANADTVTFDVTIAQEDGAVLVEIERFVVRRIADRAGLSARRPATVRDPAESADARQGSGDELLAETLRAGIRPAEGADVLARVLAYRVGPTVLVSPLRLLALRQRVDRLTAPKSPASGTFARPELASTFAAPRTAVEKQLAVLWQEVLGVDRVGIADDFFQLGGQSLVAVRLLSRMKKTWGVDLPLATFFEAPTVEQLAAVVQAELGTDAVPAGDGAGVRSTNVKVQRRGWSTVVPIQPRGGRTPFYCAAGQGGNAMNLRHLAVHLGDDQPFYGLQARGVDGRLKPHETVAAMAAEYLADIRRFQPKGPYLIGGYSGGGTAAFEMAQQLAALGEEVGLLVFLDSQSPQMPTRSRMERMRLHARRLVAQGPGYAFEKLKDRFVAHELWYMKRLVLQPLAKLFPYHFRSDSMVYSWIDAFTRYEPKPWPGRAHLFRVKLDDAHQWSAIKLEEDLGWRHLLRELVVAEVPGNHNSMCEEPHVRVLADRLRAVLDEAQRRGSEAALPPAPTPAGTPTPVTPQVPTGATT
jgi:acyl transferase domain-containing protein/thioesterase domain-containing protein/acyl carrier protein